MSYREVVRPAEGPLLALLTGFLIVGVFTWFAAGRQLLFSLPPLPVWDTAPWSDPVMLLLWVVFGLVLPASFFVVRTVVEVGDGELRVQSRPRRGQVVPLRGVRQVQVVALTAEELRRSFRGRAFGYGGGDGVVLTLDDGTNVFVESRHPEDLSAALYRAR